MYFKKKERQYELFIPWVVKILIIASSHPVKCKSQSFVWGFIKNTTKGTNPSKICILIIICLKGKQMKTKVVFGLRLTVISKTRLQE